MHYYQFNIGDYVSHTRHLSPVEDIAYRRLLDAYYLQERPLNSSPTSVARQIGMREYESEVVLVLEEFFELGQDGWTNSRADKEIEHYHSKIQQASRAGKASAERRMNGRQTDVQPTNNQETINKNQEPITNNQKPKPQKKAPAVLCPAGVDPKVWSDWLEIRKAKSLPLTETAWSQLEAECQKAGITVDTMIKECCLRGWAAFKAAWWEKEGKARGSFETQGDRNAKVISGLTRGLLGSGNNVKLLGN
jgi:uncharacterized protein YdaU (DUF1376 family)